MTKLIVLDESANNSNASSVVKIFENVEFGKVRVVSISGEPWFVGNDVAKALGYIDPKDAIRRIVDDDDRFVYDVDNQEGYETTPIENQYVKKITLINESGLYTLILRSNMDKAKNFKRWVTSEVLPSIRKTGSYSTNKKELLKPSNYKEQVEGLAVWVQMVGDMLNMNDASKVSYLQKVGEPLLLPVPDYVPSKGVVKSATELLKANGVPLSAIAFNKIAVDKGALVELSRKSSHGYKKFKNISADWLEFGENQVNPNNPKETQPLWYENKFSELLRKLGIL